MSKLLSRLGATSQDALGGPFAVHLDENQAYSAEVEEELFDVLVAQAEAGDEVAKDDLRHITLHSLALGFPLPLSATRYLVEALMPGADAGAAFAQRRKRGKSPIVEEARKNCRAAVVVGLAVEKLDVISVDEALGGALDELAKLLGYKSARELRNNCASYMDVHMRAAYSSPDPRGYAQRSAFVHLLRLLHSMGLVDLPSLLTPRDSD